MQWVSLRSVPSSWVDTGKGGAGSAQEPLGAHQAATTSPRHDRWLDAACTHLQRAVGTRCCDYLGKLQKKWDARDLQRCVAGKAVSASRDSQSIRYSLQLLAHPHPALVTAAITHCDRTTRNAPQAQSEWGKVGP